MNDIMCRQLWWNGMVLRGEKQFPVHNILHVDFVGIEAQALRWQVWKEAGGSS
jgi:hypothetical protein